MLININKIKRRSKKLGMMRESLLNDCQECIKFSILHCYNLDNEVLHSSIFETYEMLKYTEAITTGIFILRF